MLQANRAELLHTRTAMAAATSVLVASGGTVASRIAETFASNNIARRR